MKLYFVTFDVVENQLDETTVKSREKLIINYLRSLNARQTLNSQWAMKTNKSAEAILAELKEFFGLSDRCVVVESIAEIEHWWTLESLNGMYERALR